MVSIQFLLPLFSEFGGSCIVLVYNIKFFNMSRIITWFKTWIDATRAWSLGLSMSPMLLVLAALIHDGVLSSWRNILLYFLCVIVAAFAHLTTNLANDYFDFIGNKDTIQNDGFERSLLQGTMTPKQIRNGSIVTLLICATTGLVIVLLQGWHLILLGLFVLVCAFAYSAGPYPLSHHGLGDIAVLIFFGLAPILGTYYAITNSIPSYLIFLAIGMGIWVDNVLMVNNYRDYAEDKATGKNTIIVQWGREWGPRLYLLNTFLAATSFVIALILLNKVVGVIIFLSLWIPLCIRPCSLMFKVDGHRELNKIITQTINIAVLITFALSLILLL